MKRTGGNWDPKEPPVYFIASNVESLVSGAKAHTHLLVAVNELGSQANVDQIKRFVDEGYKVFIDSGVFWLTNEHARKHNMRMDEVLALAPTAIDGFDELYQRYSSLIADIGDRVWGYIEIDQGGKENKRKTRAKLEKQGFRPIPVYHPLVDGWDYFDELATKYDRICFGNVVQADPPTRKRLIATAWERRRQYPNLWIHLLGVTPSELLAAFPINSCDSSTWLRLARWASDFRSTTCNRRLWPVEGLRYDYEAEPDDPAVGHRKVRRVGAYEGHMAMRTMRAMASEWSGTLGADIGLYQGRGA